MAETNDSWLAQLYRAAFASGVLMSAAVLVVLIAIFGHAEWHPQLVRFMARVWREFVTYNAGSTSPGFVSSILYSFLGVVVLALYIAHGKGAKALKDYLTDSAPLAIFGIATVIFIVYGTQFAWNVAKVGYEDHHALASKVGSLQRETMHMVDPQSRDIKIQQLKQEVRNYKNAQPTRQVTTLRFSRANVTPTIDLGTYVGLTNLPVSPVKATFSCTGDFKFISADATASEKVLAMKGVGDVTSRKVDFSFQTPAWDKSDPIVITVLVPKVFDMWGCKLDVH